MTYAQCACGYAPEDADDLSDHLLEMFAPQDAIGADGRVHDEVSPDCVRVVGDFPAEQRVPLFVCFCGFGTDETPEFDDHVLAMFLTPDRIGVDGGKHAPMVPA